MLIDKSLRGSAEGSEARAVGRARTLTVLPRLYVSRKSSVLQFLYEAGLIRPEIDETKETTVVKPDNADLSAADLRGAFLLGAELPAANLSGTDLRGADLRVATGITNEELERQAESLEGAVMPDGSKHP